jgi:anti-anti-sigma factor
VGSTPSWRILKASGCFLIERFTKGVIIKFRARVSGIFEIIQPVLDKGEVFDSGLLKDTVNSLIAEGRRNFAIDLSPLDYIYSDAINAILAINRRILDVSGRLSLLSPIAEVRSILERAGLHNILKIYDSEAELLKSSEDIILQTTRFNLSELKSYQDQKPKSEFEDFRSQIGAAMKAEAPVDSPTSFGSESFESEITDDAFAMQQPKKRPQAPRIEEPFVPPAPPPPPPRQAAYPFEGGPAPIPRRPSPAPQQPFPVEQDSFEFQGASPEMPRSKPRPSAPAQPAAAPRRPDRDYDRFDAEEDDFDEDMPKRSTTPMIIGAIVLVIVAIVGFIGYNTFIKKSPDKSALAPLNAHTPATKTMPELAQPAQPGAPSPATSAPPAATPAASAPAAAAAASTPPAPDVTEPVKSEKKQAAKQASSQSKSGESYKKQAASKISISSKPSGATVTVDGKVIGTTPFKWSDPPQGTILIVATKSGYNDATKTIEFTGGSKSEFLSLSKIPRETAVSAPISRAERAEPAYQRPSEPPPEESAPPPPSRAEEPEPAPESPSASSSSAPSPSSSLAGGGSGESATIFISSMPPVADVYMDGKLIGKTNISKLNVTSGTHSMKYVKGAIEVTEDMTFKSGDNPSHLVILKK